VLVIGYLPMDFWNLWCHTMAEAGGRFRSLVADGARVAEFAFVAEVDVGRGWVGGMVARMEVLTYAPVGEGCQQCTEAPQVLPFLY
jgi:hypothetical protein